MEEYISGVEALNMHVDNTTSGDWHSVTNASRRVRFPLCNTEDSPCSLFDKWGIVFKDGIYIANNQRAVADMIWYAFHTDIRRLWFWENAVSDFLDDNESIINEMIPYMLKLRGSLTKDKASVLDRFLVGEFHKKWLCFTKYS